MCSFFVRPFTIPQGDNSVWTPYVVLLIAAARRVLPFSRDHHGEADFVFDGHSTRDFEGLSTIQTKKLLPPVCASVRPPLRFSIRELCSGFPLHHLAGSFAPVCASVRRSFRCFVIGHAGSQPTWGARLPPEAREIHHASFRSKGRSGLEKQ